MSNPVVVPSTCIYEIMVHTVMDPTNNIYIELLIYYARCMILELKHKLHLIKLIALYNNNNKVYFRQDVHICIHKIQ